MSAVYLHAMGITCALGLGASAVQSALFSSHPQALSLSERYSPGRPLALGEVTAALPCIQHLPLPLRSRNNALLLASLEQIRSPVDGAIARFGPQRVGVVLGVSTAGLSEGEAALQAFFQANTWPPEFAYNQQEMGNPATCLGQVLGVHGPVHAISSACASGPKAMASAARLLRAGIVDAVVTGGVDALCRFTLEGFRALASVSETLCNPLSVNRCGINLGEGSALFLMQRETGPVRLAGWGESSDAHHMSAPDPSGRGAIDAMQQALRRADIAPQAVDYVNLHGTATPHNDAMESLAIAQVLGAAALVSSTKPLTGHALAASGAIEAALAWLTLIDNPSGHLPAHLWDGQTDPALPPLRTVAPGQSLGRPVRHVLSNSFAFGGSNAALLLSAP
jgi:3-oxoacyl-[acyl-carrier-protein] synthase I